jgi:hypothetical protein
MPSPPAAGTEETVLRMLKQADAARWAEARRAEELELEMREREALHEVQMRDAQLENLEVGPPSIDSSLVVENPFDTPILRDGALLFP